MVSQWSHAARAFGRGQHLMYIAHHVISIGIWP
jgi:hypothetical protein